MKEYTSIGINEMEIALQDAFGDRAMAFDILLGLALAIEENKQSELIKEK